MVGKRVIRQLPLKGDEGLEFMSWGISIICFSVCIYVNKFCLKMTTKFEWFNRQ